MFDLALSAFHLHSHSLNLGKGRVSANDYGDMACNHRVGHCLVTRLYPQISPGTTWNIGLELCREIKDIQSVLIKARTQINTDHRFSTRF